MDKERRKLCTELFGDASNKNMVNLKFILDSERKRFSSEEISILCKHFKMTPCQFLKLNCKDYENTKQD